MKKILSMIVLILSFSCASVMAQKTETKIKPKTTARDKVHNVFHPRHTRHPGYKYNYKHKHKTATSKVTYLKPKETHVETT